jgi:hypothetical protein
LGANAERSTLRAPREETTMAVAYVQEFEIVDGDTSTANYDAVAEKLGLASAPDGLIVHTAGFDHDAGVFRIFDVWESREQGERFVNERLQPVLGEIMAAHPNPESLTPPDREGWYELHDMMT